MCRGIFSHSVTETDADGQPVQVWHRQQMACINMIASNVPKLGADHPICEGAAAARPADKQTSRPTTGAWRSAS